jgi:hypothetical protein
VVRLNIMEVRVCGKGWSPQGSQKTERKRKKRDRKRYYPPPTKDMSPVIYSLEPDPHLLKISVLPKIAAPTGHQAFNT